MNQEHLYHHQPSILAVMASYFAEALLLPAAAVMLSLMLF